jgi:hypothetical protein
MKDSTGQSTSFFNILEIKGVVGDILMATLTASNKQSQGSKDKKK